MRLKYLLILILLSVFGSGGGLAQEPPTEENPCRAAPPSLLSVGQPATIQDNRGVPLNVRDEPSTYGSLVGQVPGRTQVEILDGPFCGRANNLFTWWQIRTPDGLEGWIAEGDAQRSGDQYFVMPVGASSVPASQASENIQDCPAGVEPRLEVGGVAVVEAGETADLRQSPPGQLIQRLNAGALMRVVGGPQCGPERGRRWWEVTAQGGQTGWVPEGDGSQDPPDYYLRPAGDTELAALLRDPQQLDCVAAPPTILEIGDTVQVPAETGGFSVTLRDAPDGEAVQPLPIGTQMVIQGGPECGNFFAYWQVQTTGGAEGWVAEGDSTQNPPQRFLALLMPHNAEALREQIDSVTTDDANAAGLEDPTTCQDAPPTRVTVGENVQVLQDVTLRADPTLRGAEIRVLASGTIARLMQGPRCGLGDDRLVWWQAMLPDGGAGWLPEGDASAEDAVYYLEPFE